MRKLHPPRCRERTALITRFRRACPGSERTNDGYIERPIIPPIPAGMGASGQRQFGSCQLYPDRDKENVQLYSHASVGLAPGSERTSDGYIERPIIPHFLRESPLAIPAENGGELPAAVW